MNPELLRHLQQVQPVPVLGALGACFLLWVVGMQVVIELATPAALIGGAAIGFLAHQGQMPAWGQAALQAGASVILFRLVFIRRPDAARKGKVDINPARTAGGLQVGRTLLDLLTFWMPARLKAGLGLSGEDAGSTIYSGYRR